MTLCITIINNLFQINGSSYLRKENRFVYRRYPVRPRESVQGGKRLPESYCRCTCAYPFTGSDPGTTGWWMCDEPGLHRDEGTSRSAEGVASMHCSSLSEKDSPVTGPFSVVVVPLLRWSGSPFDSRHPHVPWDCRNAGIDNGGDLRRDSEGQCSQYCREKYGCNQNHLIQFVVHLQLDRTH